MLDTQTSVVTSKPANGKSPGPRCFTPFLDDPISLFLYAWAIRSRYGSRELADDGSGRRGGSATMADVPSPGSVVTSLAGFAGRLPQPPGGRTAIPAALRYAPAVSGSPVNNIRLRG